MNQFSNLVITILIFCMHAVNGMKEIEFHCKNGSVATNYAFCVNQDYLKEEPSFINNKILKVSVIVQFGDIVEVNDVFGTVRFDAFLTVSWCDERLIIMNNGSIWNNQGMGSTWTSLNIKTLDYIWNPDLYIDNIETYKVKKISAPVGDLALSSNKRFRYNFPVKISLNCPHFEYDTYPFDVQFCDFSIGSYLWTQELVKFSGNMTYNGTMQRPLQYKVRSIEPLSFEEGLLNYPWLTYKDSGELESSNLIYSHFSIRIKLSRIL